MVAFVADSGWINGLDVRVELFLNHFAHKFGLLDWCMGIVASSFFFRGGVVLLFVWYVLFDSERPGKLRKDAEIMLGTLLTSIVIMPGIRLASYLLPFRTRPIATPLLHFVSPVANTQGLQNWSSFPSDHAMLFFALATGVFFMSRRAGVLAYLWVAAAVCFPRLYLGYHWFTDILAGAVLGVGFASISLIPGFRRWTERIICPQYSKHPALFCSILFLYSFQVGTMFEDARQLLILAFQHFKG